ncbi:hypothetical protein V8C44DRAFT_188827 [Trichoderma aethiopicum]
MAVLRRQPKFVTPQQHDVGLFPSRWGIASCPPLAKWEANRNRSLPHQEGILACQTLFGPCGLMQVYNQAVHAYQLYSRVSHLRQQGAMRCDDNSEPHQHTSQQPPCFSIRRQAKLTVTRRHCDKDDHLDPIGTPNGAYEVPRRSIARRWAVSPRTLHNLGIRPEQRATAMSLSQRSVAITYHRCNTVRYTRRWGSIFDPSLHQCRATQYLSKCIALLASR